MALPVKGSAAWFVVGLIVLAVLYESSPKYGAWFALLVVLALLLTASKTGVL